MLLKNPEVDVNKRSDYDCSPLREALHLLEVPEECWTQEHFEKVKLLICDNRLKFDINDTLPDTCYIFNHNHPCDFEQKSWLVEKYIEIEKQHILQQVWGGIPQDEVQRKGMFGAYSINAWWEHVLRHQVHFTDFIIFILNTTV